MKLVNLEKVNVSNTDPVVVLWDGKLLPNILKTESCEKLSIAISFNNKEQLLGISAIENSSGEEQATAVYESLREWGVADKVKAMCFDTTASNTGRVKGSKYWDESCFIFPTVIISLKSC